MLVALVCLWIGFALGFCCGAVLRVGARANGDRARRDGIPAVVPDRRRNG